MNNFKAHQPSIDNTKKPPIGYYSEFSRIPPQAIDLEEAVLGAIMLEKEAFDEISSILKPESFYKPSHEIIFQACRELSVKSMPIDLLTVKNQLQKSGQLDEIGGVIYLNSLTQRIGAASNIVFHSRIIQQKYIQREFIRISSSIREMAFDDSIDVSDLIDFVDNEFFKVTQNNIEKEPEHIKNIIKSELKELDNRLNNNSKLLGINTLSHKLNKKICGWQKNDLVIVAARPSMGKSAFAVENLLKCGVPCALFSLEVSKEKVTKRAISHETNIAMRDFKEGNLSETDLIILNKNLGKLSDLPIFIDDTPGLNLFQLRRRVRKLIKKYGIELIIIDYLQLMTSLDKKQNREGEISEISRGLKLIAKEFNIVVIALSQLNRAVEMRSSTGHKPILSDLRESGCLDGDTKIQCPINKKIYKIKDLVNSKNIDILNTDGFSVKSNIAKKCFSTGVKKCFKLKLLNEQELILTSNHKLLAYNEKLETKSEWIALENLMIGDMIAIPIDYDNNSQDDNINDSEISLVGHFLSNGCALKRHCVKYTHNILDDDLTKKVITDAIISTNYEVDPYFKDTIKVKSSHRDIFFKSKRALTHGARNPVSELLDKYGLFDVRCKDKFIPDKLFFLSHEQTCILLKSLFSGDGTVYYQEKNGRKSLKISYSSASNELILGIQQLLSKVGILSFITHNKNKKGQKWDNLYISGKSNIELFVKNIGFIQKRKNDVMQNGWDKSKNILAGWNKYKFNTNRTLCYMPIKCIEYVGERDVYDMEVSVFHNFVANNIIVHNSIEQDADIVIFLHRPEKYGFIEDEDGNSLKNIVFVIAAKHRDGELFEIPLYVSDQSLIRWSDTSFDSTNYDILENRDFYGKENDVF